MPSIIHDSPIQQRSWQAGLLLSFLLIVSLLSPLTQEPLAYHEDWLHTFSELYRTGAQYGKDVQFTFGPWGFLYGGYHPKTFTLTCLFWLATSILLWFFGKRVFNPARIGLRPQTSALLLCGWALLLGGRNSAYSDSRFFLPPLALLLNHFYLSKKKIDWHALSLAAWIGFSGTVKLTYLVIGALAVGVITLDQLLRRKYLPGPALVMIGVFIAAWCCAGQEPAGLPRFFHVSRQVIGGFSAMAIHTRFDAVETLGFVGIGMAMWSLVVLKPRAGDVMVWLCLAVMILLVFRASVVRHDGHFVLGAGWLCMAAPLLAFSRWRDLTRAGRSWALLVIVGSMLLQVEAGLRYEPLAIPFSPLHAIASLVRLPQELVNAARGLPTRPARVYDQTLAKLRMDEPLPPLKGTVDLIPLETDVVLANGFQLAPRPTLQSYGAYTLELATANAEYFAGVHRPENLIMRVAAMDNRLPSMEDNLAWPELFKHYQLAGIFKEHFVLTVRRQPRTMTATPLTRLRIALNEPFVVPSTPHDGLLWARISLSAKPLGSLAAQFYKPPEAYLAVRLRNGHTAKHRMILANCAAGFLLGPYIESNTTFIETINAPRASETLQPYMPTQATVVTSATFWPKVYFEREAQVEFDELRFVDSANPGVGTTQRTNGE